MALGSTTWLQAVPVVVVAVLLLVAPGAVGARLTGLRGPTALGAGPLLTTSAIALGGIAAGAVGISWGPAPLAASLLVLLVLCAVVGVALRRRPEPQDADGSLASLLTGTALAAAVVALAVVPATGRPTAFPQSPDTIYHLGSIHWMLDRADISSLHAAGFASTNGTGFYPAAFHAVAATVAQLTGASPVVAASSVVLAVSAVVWPLGLILLARRVLGAGWWPTLAAALAAVAFSGFPFWLMGYGALWPNLFGQSLLPATLALLLAVVDGPRRARSLVVGLMALPGLAIAHPNALIALVLIGTLVIVLGLLYRAWALRASRRTSIGLLLGAVVAASGLAAVWAAMTAISVGMRASNPKGPEMTVDEGVVDVLFLAPRALSPLWVAGLVTLAGIVVLVVRRRHLWIVLAHLMVTGLYLAIVLVDNPVTRLFTWPWYNNSPRLAALMVLTAALLAAAALTEAAELLRRRLRPHSGSLRSRRPALVAAGAVGVVFAVATAGVDTPAHRHVLSDYFEVPAERAWASEADLQALHTLGARIPADAVVAANPWRGGPFLYLTSDRTLLFPTEKAWAEGDRQLLGADLDRAADNSDVCAAARRQNVSWVLTGGTSQTDSAAQDRRYAGIDGVPSAPGFSLVDRAGSYALYRLDACAGG